MMSHPKDLGDDLVAAVAGLASVCEHVHLPAQAGSDRVLAAMRRGYSAARYLERVHALRTAVPDVSITTDLIAGFPGETEGDFEQTLSLVREAAFDAAFTFVYSPRPGTAAAELPGQVPADVRRERVERLIGAVTAAGACLAAGLGGASGGGARGRDEPGRPAPPRTHATERHGEPRRRREAGAIVTVEVTAATSTTLRGTTV